MTKATSPTAEPVRVRRGGLRVEGGYLFELTGGTPCLDLANTVDNRPSARKRRDLLGSYADLAGWAQQAGLIRPEEAALLLREASARPRAAELALRRARDVREAIFETVSSAIIGQPPPARFLARLNTELGRALAQLRLVRRGDGYAWAWDARHHSLDRVVWPVVRSACELLVSADLRRARRCAAEDCAWLFLDGSKNGSRRWCDMAVCGNRAKIRRYRLGLHDPS